MGSGICFAFRRHEPRLAEVLMGLQEGRKVCLWWLSLRVRASGEVHRGGGDGLRDVCGVCGNWLLIVLSRS